MFQSLDQTQIRDFTNICWRNKWIKLVNENKPVGKTNWVVGCGSKHSAAFEVQSGANWARGRITSGQHWASPSDHTCVCADTLAVCQSSVSLKVTSGQFPFRWKAPCVSLLQGIFWTSECLSPQMGQDRSVGKLKLQEQSLPSEGHCWRNPSLPRPAVGSSEVCSHTSATFCGVGPRLPTAVALLTVAFSGFAVFPASAQPSSQCFLGPPSQKLLVPKSLTLGLSLRESKLSQ